MTEKELIEQQLIASLQAALVRAAAKNWKAVNEAVADVTVLLDHLMKLEH